MRIFTPLELPRLLNLEVARNECVMIDIKGEGQQIIVGYGVDGKITIEFLGCTFHPVENKNRIEVK